MSQQDILAQFANWANRQIEKGFKGFELFVRDGSQLSLVDRYAADKKSIEAIVADAFSNAQGAEVSTSFQVQAVNDGSGPWPSRSLVVPASAPLHEPERYEERNSLRLLLEHVDKQNRVIAQVVPACLMAMGGMVQGLSSHFANIAETHEAALKTLRENRVEHLESERAMFAEAAKQARTDKLLDVGMAMIPTVLAKLGDKENKS
jgi:hypothetical protein